jgi:16S rRNA (cytosine967-C5)-methyltransferase
LKKHFVGDWPAPPPTVAEKAVHLGEIARAPLLPEWFRAHCPAVFAQPELDALHTRAPLWLRLQTDSPQEVFAEFSARSWMWRAASALPQAVELLSEADVTTTQVFARGLVEIQDLGSQLILASVAPRIGERWLDVCAGAGGKTLQLARLLGSSGHVTAHDVRPAALAELRTRAARAGLRNVSVNAAPAGEFDGVLVDAPCSGSGTWRRAPHLKWSTTEADIHAAAARQREILALHAPRVRPGGLLVYATCSLSRAENEDVAAAFLAAHPHFSAAPASPAHTIFPSVHNTDGFFVTAFRRA